MPGIARGLGKSHQLCSLHMCLCGTSACEHNYGTELSISADVFHMGSPVTANVIRALIRPKDLLEEEAAVPLHWPDRRWRGTSRATQHSWSSALAAQQCVIVPPGSFSWFYLHSLTSSDCYYTEKRKKKARHLLHSQDFESALLNLSCWDAHETSSSWPYFTALKA